MNTVLPLGDGGTPWKFVPPKTFFTFFSIYNMILPFEQRKINAPAIHRCVSLYSAPKVGFTQKNVFGGTNFLGVPPSPCGRTVFTPFQKWSEILTGSNNGSQGGIFVSGIGLFF